MEANELYQRAWQRLLREIQKKTGWGNIELQKLMLDCLVNPEKAMDIGFLLGQGKTAEDILTINRRREMNTRIVEQELELELKKIEQLKKAI